MLNITIKTIPHKEHRYDTVGDWWWEKDGSLEMRVSDMKNWKYEFLVAFHEFAEAMICKHKGIKQSDVDKFDRQFERNRPKGNIDEPGDDPKAPYRSAHFWATNVERILSELLEVDWKDYDKTVVNL